MLLAAAAIVGGIQWMRADELPVPVYPPHPLPSPNAFDTYVRAAQSVVPTDSHTGVSVKSSAKELDATPLTARQALVRVNAPAFALLHQGFTQTAVSPALRGIEARVPYYTPLRRLGRLLSLTARVRAEQGDYDGAFRIGLDGVRLGTDIPRGAPLLGESTGESIETVSRQHLWGMVEKITDPKIARTAAARLETIEARRVPFFEVEREEKYFLQSCLVDELKRGTLEQARGLMGYGASETTLQKALSTMRASPTALRLSIKGRRAIYRDFTNYMDFQIRAVHVPYATLPPFPPVPNDPMNQEEMLMFTAQPQYFRWTSNVMGNELLIAALALRAYCLEHHDYPASLEALATEGYVTHTPTDPFAPRIGTPLCYRRLDADHILLYSRGGDGKDDGGKPVVMPAGHYYLPEGVAGDFVYGKNTWPR